ncbi:MAG TPA: hypothetical protein VK183_00335 [Flavobacterium sp.]|nr:hypothetical protein [Flavobacterium sp.]
MENIKNLKEWRSEEIAKIFLLRSSYDLCIDKFPTPMFDFFVCLRENTNVKFAVEVKISSSFKNSLKKQFEYLKTYRDANLINIPVLLFKIDEVNETGELDFLVIPSFIEQKLLIRNDFQFQNLNKENLDNKIAAIVKWCEKK